MKKINTMKNLLFIFTILISTCASAQKKKPKRSNIPPPPIVKQLKIAVEPAYKVAEVETEKCYVNKLEEKKEGKVFVTEYLFKYGWAGDNARFVITEYNYDPVEIEKAKKEGVEMASSQSLHFIDGRFGINKDIVTFTPDKNEKYKNKTFHLIYKAKSKTVNSLQDEDKKIFKIGKCPEPIISM